MLSLRCGCIVLDVKSKRRLLRHFEDSKVNTIYFDFFWSILCSHNSELFHVFQFWVCMCTLFGGILGHHKNWPDVEFWWERLEKIRAGKTGEEALFSSRMFKWRSNQNETSRHARSKSSGFYYWRRYSHNLTHFKARWIVILSLEAIISLPPMSTLEAT